MFERFTEGARQVVVVAQEEARALRHDHVGTEHLLLGLLGEEDGVATGVLASLGLTVEHARSEVARTVVAGEKPTAGQIPFTPRSKQVLELALREALSLGHNFIGSEHLLLSLARAHDGVAARILEEAGAEPGLVRHAVLRMLAAPGGPPSFAPVAPRPPLDWQRARLLWRPEGLELRIPLRLPEGALAAFAADGVWAEDALRGLRREIWSGWVALASPTLLDDVDPRALRALLDAAAARAADGRGREQGRVEDFLRGLREAPPPAGPAVLP